MYSFMKYQRKYCRIKNFFVKELFRINIKLVNFKFYQMHVMIIITDPYHSWKSLTFETTVWSRVKLKNMMGNGEIFLAARVFTHIFSPTSNFLKIPTVTQRYWHQRNMFVTLTNFIISYTKTSMKRTSGWGSSLGLCSH